MNQTVEAIPFSLRWIFTITLLAALLLGTVIVLAQIAGLIIGSPNLLEWPMQNLSTPAVLCAATAGAASFIGSYFYSSTKTQKGTGD